ncbi:hypothetical protein [Bradyrhizobium sp. USDA 4451]
MVVRELGLSNCRKMIMRNRMAIAMHTSVQQQSGRWTGQDAQMTERMDAIRNPGTMAGSPDADRTKRISVSPSWHGLCASGRRAFVKP